MMNLSNGTHVSADRIGADEVQELEHLRAENEELRSLVLELEQALRHQHGGGQDEEARQREYESLLEEKSEIIRNLHRKVQALEQELASQEEEAPKPAVTARPAGGGAVPREEELMVLSEELERERRQLKEDEEALMEQMREMEVQMARERAELARQRNELQRLQNDLHHELELAARDGTLRDRLAPLQRKHADVVARKGAAPAAGQQNGHAQPQPSKQPQEQQPEKKKGLFGGLFGGNNK
jgi:DNA repair exonuclease SbcCD ATPase subunit